MSDLVCLSLSRDHALESLFEVGERLDVIETACLYDRRSDRPMVSTRIGTSKESILARQDNWSDGPLDNVGVEFDPAIVQE